MKCFFRIGLTPEIKIATPFVVLFWKRCNATPTRYLPQLALSRNRSPLIRVAWCNYNAEIGHNSALDSLVTLRINVGCVCCRANACIALLSTSDNIGRIVLRVCYRLYASQLWSVAMLDVVRGFQHLSIYDTSRSLGEQCLLEPLLCLAGRCTYGD